MELKGAIAIVTGASAGIGRATAIELARRGATVVAVARSADRLEATAAEMRRYSPASIPSPADLSSRAACERLVADVTDRFGRVDVVVNNAGISIRKPAWLTTVDDVERVMALNFMAPVTLTTVALPGMLERRKGSIINVTSVAGYLPNPKESAYGASKAALSIWSHVLAVDLHGTGVHVGVVSPGAIDTEIWAMDEFAASYKGKLWPPEVVARAIAKSIERDRVQVTAPRRFGFPPMLYALFGRPMRRGLRRYEERAERRATRA